MLHCLKCHVSYISLYDCPDVSIYPGQVYHSSPPPPFISCITQFSRLNNFHMYSGFKYAAPPVLRLRELDMKHVGIGSPNYAGRYDSQKAVLGWMWRLRRIVVVPVSATMSSGSEGHLVSVDYEVFGKVQGVFFRKHTQKEAKRLGLVGWVQNTERGTVKGQLQGADERVRAMQTWLSMTGSPRSRIEKAEFTNQKWTQQRDFSDFQIIK